MSELPAWLRPRRDISQIDGGRAGPERSVRQPLAVGGPAGEEVEAPVVGHLAQILPVHPDDVEFLPPGLPRTGGERDLGPEDPPDPGEGEHDLVGEPVDDGTELGRGAGVPLGDKERALRGVVEAHLDREPFAPRRDGADDHRLRADHLPPRERQRLAGEVRRGHRLHVRGRRDQVEQVGEDEIVGKDLRDPARKGRISRVDHDVRHRDRHPLPAGGVDVDVEERERRCGEQEQREQ
jgi:hypothetical protein